MGTTFFIADTHFHHEAILRYEQRPFDSVELMDETLIENWNKRVKPSDTVFHLGDVSSGDESFDKIILGRLHGYKILVMGNHDRHRAYRTWLSLGFAEVSSFPIVFNDFLFLSHEPLYVCSAMPYANIFGHVHGNPSYRDSSPQSVCVSVERIGYSPVSLEEIMGRLRS